MVSERGSQWSEWVIAVALSGGLLLGGLAATFINGAFFPDAGAVVQLAVWTVVLLAFGGAAALLSVLRLKRLDADR